MFKKSPNVAARIFFPKSVDFSNAAPSAEIKKIFVSDSASIKSHVYLRTMIVISILRESDNLDNEICGL